MRWETGWRRNNLFVYGISNIREFRDIHLDGKGREMSNKFSLMAFMLGKRLFRHYRYVLAPCAESPGRDRLEDGAGCLRWHVTAVSVSGRSLPIGVNPSVYRPLRYQYGGDGCYRYLSPAVYDGAFRYLFRYNLFNDERHDLPRYLVACAQGYPNGPGGGVALRIICRIITND